MNAFFLLMIDWQKWRPENWFGGQILERTPAGLSLVYMAGVGLLVLLLLLSFIRNRRKKFAFEIGLPREVKRKLSSTATNRSLRIWQFVFVLLALFVYGVHFYWAAVAEKQNERFQELSIRDVRYRRSTSSQLRGWMFDRSGKLDKALAYYKKAPDGTLARTYPLDREMALLLGTELGSPGLERTLYKQSADPMPEAWEVLTKVKKPEEEQKDVRITIDRDLQTFLAQELDVELKKGRKGAIVVINPQTGDVLGMYSTPSFLLTDIKSADDLERLDRNKKDEPLLSRATREFYMPGSTFKTFTMMSAYRAGKDKLMFASFPNGYFPEPKMRPIVDATQHYDPGSKTVSGKGCDGGCEEKDIRKAYTVSSNQYFAQMAVALGRDRLKETAAVVGIAAVDSPSDIGKQGYYADIWNTSNRRIAEALAPAKPIIVTGNSINLFDLATEGYGQGYARQMTPFQMALIASIPANMNGNLMKAKIEADIPPQPFGQVVSPQQAAYMRETMAHVTEETGGTAQKAFGAMDKDVRVGGKTGTAEIEVPEFNPDGTRHTIKSRHKINGEMVPFDKPTLKKRTDSWFICIAPLGSEENPEIPQLAIAVVVEGGGFGATTAAPIAIRVIKKARELGLLGDKYKPKTTTTTQPNRKRR